MSAPRHRARSGHRRHVPLLLAVLVLVLGTGRSVTPTDAGWTDQATAQAAVSTGWWAESLARAQLIEVDGLGLDVLDATTTDAEYPDAPGPATSAIDIAALESLVGLELPGLRLPLVGDGNDEGLLDLGEAAGAGLLNGYAATTDYSVASAASGTVTDDGGLDLSPVDDPSDTDLARLSLTALLDDLQLNGLTDAVVDDVSLGLGALASTASWEAGGAPSADYVLAGAELRLSSPAVGSLASELAGAVSTLNDRLNSILGPEGPLQQTVDVLDALSFRIPLIATVDLGDPTLHAAIGLDALVDELLATPLVDDDGLVMIDLSAGHISVDVERLVEGGDLNGLPANTDLLTAENLDRIVSSVGALLGSIIDRVAAAVETALNETTLHLRIGAEIDLLGLIGVVDADITSAITVGALLAGEPVELEVDASLLGIIPADDLLGPVLDLLTELGLPPLTGLLGDLLTNTVPNLIGELVEPVVSGVSGTLLPVLDPLLSQLVQITVNSQELTGPPGGEVFTARALAIELLPVLGDASVTVGLATSTVRVWQPSSSSG